MARWRQPSASTALVAPIALHGEPLAGVRVDGVQQSREDDASLAGAGHRAGEQAIGAVRYARLHRLAVHARHEHAAAQRTAAVDLDPLPLAFRLVRDRIGAAERAGRGLQRDQRHAGHVAAGRRRRHQAQRTGGRPPAPAPARETTTGLRAAGAGRRACPGTAPAGENGASSHPGRADRGRRSRSRRTRRCAANRGSGGRAPRSRDCRGDARSARPDRGRRLRPAHRRRRGRSRPAWSNPRARLKRSCSPRMPSPNPAARNR